MKYRIEFSYRAKIGWEQGRIHRDIEAESPTEAIDKLMDLDTPDGKVKDCFRVWDVDIWQKVERNKPEILTKVLTCPHYQGVCGLDDDIVCYCSSAYEMCDTYRRASDGN